MILSSAFERFVEYSPISVMTRALMESAIPPEDLDRLFDAHAERQYTRSLTFSTIVELMGVVVSKSQPSLHSAIQAVSSTLAASVTSIYDKINGVEPLVLRALVKHTSEKLSEVVTMMGGQLPALLPGHRVLVLDGNHLTATERRLEVLKRSKAGPLPGHALVVLEPELMLIRDMIPCEDGHAQERSLTPEILEMVHDADVWIDDRKIAIAESEWLTFQLMPTRALSRFLLNCAEHIELGKYKRHPRGPKKPVPKRTKYVDKMHVSTSRLLAAAKTRTKSR